MILATPHTAGGAPADVRAKRAQIADIERQLGALDGKVERAAEAFDGAQYHLGQVQTRIVESRADPRFVSKRDLGRAQATLARRLRDIYRQDQPSLAEVCLTSGSVVRRGRQDRPAGPPGPSGRRPWSGTSIPPRPCASGPRAPSWWSIGPGPGRGRSRPPGG